jgi:hypothetical protein
LCSGARSRYVERNLKRMKNNNCRIPGSQLGNAWEAHQKALRKAIRLFDSQPGFASMQVWLRDRVAEVQHEAPAASKDLGSNARAELAMKYFDLRAEPFVRLSWNVKTHRALIVILWEIEREAWRDFVGTYPEYIRSMATEASLWLREQISIARDRWIRKSYEQIASREAAETKVTPREFERLRIKKWEDLEISFLSDTQVQFRAGTDVATLNYEELGFVDRRSGKPNGAWIEFRNLAEANGNLRNTSNTRGLWRKAEKRIQELRKRLRSCFGQNTDPIPFVKGEGYCAQMKIGCALSFRTSPDDF